MHTGHITSRQGYCKRFQLCGGLSAMSFKRADTSGRNLITRDSACDLIFRSRGRGGSGDPEPLSSRAYGGKRNDSSSLKQLELLRLSTDNLLQFQNKKLSKFYKSLYFLKILKSLHFKGLYRPRGNGAHADIASLYGHVHDHFSGFML